MKNGLRVYDADTHVEPSAEVIDKYVDPGFRPRLEDLAPYRFPVRPGSPGSRIRAVSPDSTTRGCTGSTARPRAWAIRNSIASISTANVAACSKRARKRA